MNKQSADACILPVINYKDQSSTTLSASALRIYVPGKRRFLRVEDDDKFAKWDFND